MNTPTLILFAKSPIAGLAKTRFYPNCSYETAAKIAMEFIEHTLKVAKSAWNGKIKLMLSPNSHHEGVQRLLSSTGIESGSQSKGDLGLKMENAIRDEISNNTPVGLMGCDIPGVQARHLSAAYAQLCRGSNVLGPSSDGGFYFIGLQNCPKGMLQGMEWDTSNVAKAVIEKARSYQVRFQFVLECLQDVDTWEDFEFVATQFPKFRNVLNQDSPAANLDEQFQV